MKQDVQLHPLVRDGHVDLELAEALYGMSDTANSKPVSKKRRDYSKGKWLTEESEI